MARIFFSLSSGKYSYNLTVDCLVLYMGLGLSNGFQSVNYLMASHCAVYLVFHIGQSPELSRAEPSWLPRIRSIIGIVREQISFSHGLYLLYLFIAPLHLLSCFFSLVRFLLEAKLITRMSILIESYLLVLGSLL